MASEKVLYNPTGLPPVVGIYSPTARSGKGTVAEVLIRHFGYDPLKFAQPIREMFIGFARACGLDQNTIDRCLDGDLKETHIDKLGGMSYRTFAEGVGTKWGRSVVSQDFWVNLWRTRAIEMLRDGKRIVVDDVRFKNEYQAITDLGGSVVRALRPDVVSSAVLEGMLESMGFDFEIVNGGTLEELRDLVIYEFSSLSFGKYANEVLGIE